jgi:hypothetical protein
MTAEHLEKLQEKQRSLESQVQTEKQKAKPGNSLKHWQNQIEAISEEDLWLYFGN